MINPKKSLGQNFLLDKNLRTKIISTIKIKNQNIIEIGPGTGQLTDEIIKNKPNKLILIEKDSNLYLELCKKYNNTKNITIINQDVLFFNFEKFKNVTIISNLPYNISTKIIIRLLINYKDNINYMIFMVQKEVAEKMSYDLTSKINKYSFLIEALCDYKILFKVSNKVFFPRPKVQSCIIKLKPHKNTINTFDLLNFRNQIFKNKRKLLTNVIKIDKLNNNYENLINKRVESLSFKNLLKLFNSI